MTPPTLLLVYVVSLLLRCECFLNTLQLQCLSKMFLLSVQQQLNPPVFTGIQFRFSQNVLQRVVVCPHSKFMPLQPMTELIVDGPFHGKELESVSWVLRLSMSQ